MAMKALLVLCFVVCVVCNESRDGLQANLKIGRIVRLPEAEETEILTEVTADGKLGKVRELKLEDCIDEDEYSNERIRDYEDESDILCGFYAFQANKKEGSGVGLYSNAAESARRYEVFAETVESVRETNARFEKGEITWTAGINFFADMLPEEKYPYSHGIAHVEFDEEEGSDMPMLGSPRLGLGMGSPFSGDSVFGELSEDGDKVDRIVRLPEAAETEILTEVTADGKLGEVRELKLEDCIDEDAYSSERIRDYEDERDILCGFYAFQANKKEGSGVGLYSNAAESARRFEYFVETVEMVKDINAKYDKGEGTWTAGINFFADMSPEEKYPYSHGLIMPSEEGWEDEDWEDEDWDMGYGDIRLGAPVEGGARPKPRDRESDEEKMGKIVRLHESLEMEVMAADEDNSDLDLAACLDEEMYSNEKLKEYSSGRDILCGFYAFQANKKHGVGVPVYEDESESAERMSIFAESVSEVIAINSQYEKGEITWTAAINMFADMNEEERAARTRGNVKPDGEMKFGGRGGIMVGGRGGMMIGGGIVSPDGGEETSVEEKVEKIVRLSDYDESEILNSDNDDEEAAHFKTLTIENCVDESVYDYDNLKSIDSSEDYLCAFYAFQANKMSNSGVGLYSGADEAKERLALFTECVQRIQERNEAYERGEITYTSGVNFFCDMTEEEKYPYSHGIRREMPGLIFPGVEEGDESVEEKVEKIVRLSDSDESEIMNSDNDEEEAAHFKTLTIENCVDESVYDYDNLKSIDSSDEYLCAFYAFQANKKSGVGLSSYSDSDEAKERFDLFTKCVKSVQKTNMEYEEGKITYTAGVNFFCDMTAKEKYPYSHGIRTDIAEEMSVFGVAPTDLNSAIEKMSKVVRMSDEDEMSLLSKDGDDTLTLVSLESCIDSDIYHSDNVNDIVMEQDYVCAFYAFQANKEMGTGLGQYRGAKESAKRYSLFRECVDVVKEMNRKFESGKSTYSGAVNFFCDMNDDERKEYSHGINDVVGKDDQNRLMVMIKNLVTEEIFEDHPIGGL